MHIKGIGKRAGALALACAVLLGVLQPGTAEAAGEALEFHGESTYAAVSVDSGKAVNIKQAGWQTHTTIDGTYIEESSGVEKTAQLKITPQADQSGLGADETKVLITSGGLEDTYPLRAEGNNNYVFADAEKRAEQSEYIITKTGESQGIIRDTNMNWYLGTENGEIRRVGEKDKAVEFRFVENPAVVDLTMYIEHTATGSLVRADGEGPLKVDG